MKRVLSFVYLMVLIAVPALTQEPQTDPFSDYSYLWDKPKKEKKQKKDKHQEIVKPAAQPDSLSLGDTTKIENAFIIDSTKVEGTAGIGQEQLLQDSISQVAKDEKKAERQSKMADKEPAENFRAGLPPLNSSSSINGGFTYTVIDGKAYVGLVLAPEFSIGKVGVGLDVPILYGLDDKSIRTEMFKDGVGALRLIRYVRYGAQKVDPVYIKVGALGGTMIGFGGLVNNYTNSVSYEKRKIGLHYDFNIKGLVGIEGMYSDFDFSSFNLFAIRPYVRPLSMMPIPIISSLEIGATFIKDKDQTALFGSSLNGNSSTYVFTKEGIGAFGIDAGLTLLRVPFIQIDLFAGYSKLNVATDALLDSLDKINQVTPFSQLDDGFKNGDGYSAGLNFRLNFIADIFKTDIRIERLSYSEHYLPQFFDATYEINKDAKILTLAYADKMKGIYASLTGHVLQKMTLGGSILLPDQISSTSPAVVSLYAQVHKLANKFSLDARYIKGGLTDLGDAFSLDERSLAKVRFTYHLNKFLVTGVDYFWSFTPTESGYKATKFVSPFVGFSIQF